MESYVYIFTRVYTESQQCKHTEHLFYTQHVLEEKRKTPSSDISEFAIVQEQHLILNGKNKILRAYTASGQYENT